MNDNLLDALSLLSFLISVMNLNENLGQNDKQDLLQEFSSKADTLLNEIQQHLKDQDLKLNKIMEALNL